MTHRFNVQSKLSVSIYVFISADERNEIKASLRFKQNWHNDYKRPSTTKYKIFAAEVEKGVSHGIVKLFTSFLLF